MVHRPGDHKGMRWAPWAAALRGAVEGAGAGALGALAASLVWLEPSQIRAIAMGAAVAWLASSLSTAGLIAGRRSDQRAAGGSPPEGGAGRSRSERGFWWAFGVGIALRLAALGGLMVLSLRSRELSQPALLLSYVFGVVCLLPLEYGQIVIRGDRH